MLFFNSGTFHYSSQPALNAVQYIRTPIECEFIIRRYHYTHMYTQLRTNSILNLELI